MPQANGRVYWRWTTRRGDYRYSQSYPPESKTRGRTPRAYADFRDFSDVGGSREALVPPGDRCATSDPRMAELLAARRLDELEQKKRTRVVLGVEQVVGLGEFAKYHHREKKRSGQITQQWLDAVKRHLDTAVAFFGSAIDLNQISVARVQRYAGHLRELPDGRGGTLSGGSQRQYLNSLSNLFRRAQAEGCVPPGYNPVAALMEKPKAEQKEAKWLEVHEAALYLEAARTYRPNPDRASIPFPYELIATFLLTGGRKSEILGLRVDDVSFDRRIVTFRPNKHRRLKTSTSHRTVPIWPQLEGILRSHVFGAEGPRDGLLFPSPRTGGMIRDTRRLLDTIAGRIGLPKKAVRTKVFRHTYCATRLQTLDRGAPVSQYTVGKELGHGGTQLVQRVYGHLGQVRHRAEVVEYRVENHRDELEPQLRALRDT